MLPESQTWVSFFGRKECGILVPQPGIKPMPPAVEAQTLNYWTAREVPDMVLLMLSLSPYNNSDRSTSISAILLIRKAEVQEVLAQTTREWQTKYEPRDSYLRTWGSPLRAALFQLEEVLSGPKGSAPVTPSWALWILGLTCACFGIPRGHGKFPLCIPINVLFLPETSQSLLLPSRDNSVTTQAREREKERRNWTLQDPGWLLRHIIRILFKVLIGFLLECRMEF